MFGIANVRHEYLGLSLRSFPSLMVDGPMSRRCRGVVGELEEVATVLYGEVQVIVQVSDDSVNAVSLCHAFLCRF